MEHLLIGGIVVLLIVLIGLIKSCYDNNHDVDYCWKEITWRSRDINNQIYRLSNRIQKLEAPNSEEVIVSRSTKLKSIGYLKANDCGDTALIYSKGFEPTDEQTVYVIEKGE